MPWIFQAVICKEHKTHLFTSVNLKYYQLTWFFHMNPYRTDNK